MFNIAGFLDKFKKLDTEKTAQKGTIAVLLEQVLDRKIPENTFSIKNNILTIQGSPLLKNELYIKKEELLALLKQVGIVDVK